MSAAKEKIKEIYEKVGYKKTPKATDLENYFEIKKCKISVGDKQQHGFEILRKGKNIQ